MQIAKNAAKSAPATLESQSCGDIISEAKALSHGHRSHDLGQTWVTEFPKCTPKARHTLSSPYDSSAVGASNVLTLSTA